MLPVIESSKHSYLWMEKVEYLHDSCKSGNVGQFSSRFITIYITDLLFFGLLCIMLFRVYLFCTVKFHVTYKTVEVAGRLCTSAERELQQCTNAFCSLGYWKYQKASIGNWHADPKWPKVSKGWILLLRCVFLISRWWCFYPLLILWKL